MSFVMSRPDCSAVAETVAGLPQEEGEELGDVAVARRRVVAVDLHQPGADLLEPLVGIVGRRRR